MGIGRGTANAAKTVNAAEELIERKTDASSKRVLL
jgi:hypothetical protein